MQRRHGARTGCSVERTDGQGERVRKKHPVASGLCVRDEHGVCGGPGEAGV